MDSFSEQLRAESQPLWSSIFSQPFLREIKDGTLPLEKFRLLPGPGLPLPGGVRPHSGPGAGQGAGLSMAGGALPPCLTPVERPLHHQLLAEAGVSLEGIQRAGRSPTNTAYVNHMLATASLHGLGPTAAALLPCPWSYHELKDAVGQSEHPLYGQWTSFYVAGLLQDSVEAWRGFVDRAAEEAGPQELEAMRQAFLTSTRYEYMFWDMAYRMEQWPE